MGKFDLNEVAITRDATNLTLILIDSMMKQSGEAASEWAEFIADLTYKKGIAPVGFIIDPEEGMYMAIPGRQEKVFPELKRKFNFNLIEYIKHTDSDFWLCVYDRDENNKISQHLILYTKNKPAK